VDKDSFKVLRKSFSLTQAEIGKQLGFSRQAVINWEKGNHPLPHDIVERLAKANLTAPAQQAEAVKFVTRQSHPQCFWLEGGKNGRTARTLAHPRWWAGPGSPFHTLCSEEQWNVEYTKQVTALDLKAYVPPTAQQAYDAMVTRGISDAAARRYLAWMRSPLPGTVEPPRISMAELTDGEVTDDTIGT
jgi:DNA-binding XRE family transcriptional regulator